MEVFAAGTRRDFLRPDAINVKFSREKLRVQKHSRRKSSDQIRIIWYLVGNKMHFQPVLPGKTNKNKEKAPT